MSNIEKALVEFKEQTGFDFMKLLNDEDERHRWQLKLLEDKLRLEDCETIVQIKYCEVLRQINDTKDKM